MTEQNQITILVVEDEPEQRKLIVQMLEANHHRVASAESVEEAIVYLKSQTPDLIFSDWKLGQLTGMDLLRYVRQHHPDIGFIIATAYGTITHAVDAMQAGADDYLAKPYQRQTLLLAIDKVAKSTQLKQQNRQLTSALSEQQQLVGLVGKAPCMQKVYTRVQKISATDATVLIGGESGTGKELAARALYQLSDRHNKPFITINCGAIPESLAEAELFGAEKGAYTGANTLKIGKIEAADGGTLFLDEIGELPLLQQTKLLRFLQEGVISRVGQNSEMQLDVRVIAATHRDLQAEVAAGRFREDLYYRLNVVPIQMPSLRERREDIGRLVEHFLNLHAKQYAVEPPKLSTQALKVLLDHPWPGNVRELANRIERFVLLADEEEMLNELALSTTTLSTSEFQLPESGIEWENFEKLCLQQAMDRHQGNRTKAAKFLGLSYKAFLYRLEKYQLV
ncbi:sigma-54-dependent transcriptional regulator [Shewanella waksmanii]|uniref:sigma-54-dependent transcriptional regulator n=1 Tax=Shewanella waksmanii TaxID=213783 RepID=UPI0037362723